MVVRTNQAGVRNKREMADVRSAMPSTGASKGRKTRPRDEEAALKRTAKLDKMTLGPAAKGAEYARGRQETPLKGRKKAPSEMKVKRKGGPSKKTRLHGG